MKKDEVFDFGKRTGGAPIQWKVTREFEMFGKHMIEAVSTQPLVFFGSYHVKEALDKAKSGGYTNAAPFLCQTFSKAIGDKTFCLEEQEKIYNGRRLCYGAVQLNNNKAVFDIASGMEISHAVSDIKAAKSKKNSILITSLATDVYAYYDDNASQFELRKSDDFDTSTERYCVFGVINLIDEERK